MIQIREQDWGALSDGSVVKLFMLTNSKGMMLYVSDYGAIISSLIVPVKEKLYDVVLGFDSPKDYADSRKLPAFPYFGAIVGRYAGRIKNGEFALNGIQFQLPKNNGNNTLHGGIKGFDAVLWKCIEKNNIHNSLSLSYTSNDEEENFPGELNVVVKYTLTEENEVHIEYTATTSEDTIINLTQHSYFNLDGHEGSINEQTLQLFSDKLLEIDKENIPSGKIIKAANKGFDFLDERPCPVGIDDSFVIQKQQLPAAILRNKKNGLSLTVFTDQPSVHIYTGGNCSGQLKGKDGADYHTRSGICFETQHYPDSPNHSNFPSTVLKKGDTYHQKTIWKFSLQ